jgi:aspartokinase/homoserine dehydrogenase 1
VRAVQKGTPIGSLTGTDNLIELTTDRYRYSPMTLRGPGAGPEVTAAAVFADALKIAARV